MATRNIPSDDNIRIAGEELRRILYDEDEPDGGADWLREEFLEKHFRNIEAMIAGDDSDGESVATQLPNDELPAEIVNLLGTQLFEGQHGMTLRDKIVDRLYERGQYKEIRMMYAVTRPSSEQGDLKQQTDEEHVKKWMEKLKDHSTTKWSPGGKFACRFVDTLRLDPIFSGIKGDPQKEREEIVTPIPALKKLQPFQENMKEQALGILRNKTRAIVTLPTGAGKTRIAVDGIVEFLNKDGAGKKILWVAQSEELCEQAVQCFKQVWEQNRGGETMSIFRIWGDKRDVPSSEESGIIVAGIQKLGAALGRYSDALHGIAEDLGAVFIDEAHGSTAESYREVLNGLKISQTPTESMKLDNDGEVPVIGLTATPERSDDEETDDLHNMYCHTQIFPKGKDFPSETWEDLRDMRNHLIKEGFLSHPTFDPIKLGGKIKLTEQEEKKVKRGTFDWYMLTKMQERNRMIKERIIKLAKDGKKILYFGSSVAQAVGMSRILERNGVQSVAITGDTRKSARREYVDIFNNSDNIKVLCNYNVLSTGFDSPEIDAVMIARPTYSVVAYQQMIGRGLRGPKFGGTPECLIITVKDNIERFNGERLRLGSDIYDEEVGNND